MNTNIKISDLFLGNAELVKRLARVSQKKANIMIRGLWKTFWIMGLAWAVLTVFGAYAEHKSVWKDLLIIAGLLFAAPHTIGITYKILPAYAILSALFRGAPKGDQDIVAGVPGDFKVAMKDLAWLLMSEFGIAVLVWILPFSFFPRYAHWVLITALGAMFYSISEGTGKWWRFTMKYATVGVLLVLIGLTVISTSPWLSAKVDGWGLLWTAKPSEVSGGNINGGEGGNKGSMATKSEDPCSSRTNLCPGQQASLDAGLEIPYILEPTGIIFDEGEFMVLCSPECIWKGKRVKEIPFSVKDYQAETGKKPCFRMATPEEDPASAKETYMRLKVKAVSKTYLRGRTAEEDKSNSDKCTA